MGFADFFKKKGKEETPKPKRVVEIPPAPPKQELPSFPSTEDIPDFDMISKTAPVEKEEESAVKAQQEELEEREELELKKPIFVYLDNYKELINELTLIKNTLKESSDSLARVDAFKEDEGKEFRKWENHIKDIQKKLIYVDKTVFR